MHIVLNTPDPDDKDLLHESEASRRRRQRDIFGRVEADARDEKRFARLDYYFSHHPPNGPTLDILKGVLAAFVDNRGETPRWLTYPHLFASFARLEKAGILKIEFTLDKFKIRHYKSTSTSKPRNVRTAEVDALVVEFKKNLGDCLDLPEIPLESVPKVHGCRWVSVDKWRVSFYFGGAQRSLGCYPFSTALRLQDALAYHFSSYRRPAAYNTSEPEAREALAKHPALQAFADALETHWLAAGVLHKPAEIISTEQRLTSLEESFVEVNKKLDEIRRVMQTRHDL